jgi:hypothetical protein
MRFLNGGVCFTLILSGCGSFRYDPNLSSQSLICDVREKILDDPAFVNTFAVPLPCRKGLVGRSYSSKLAVLTDEVDLDSVLSLPNWNVDPIKTIGVSAFRVRGDVKYKSCIVYVQDWRFDENIKEGEFSLGIACD